MKLQKQSYFEITFETGKVRTWNRKQRTKEVVPVVQGSAKSGKANQMIRVANKLEGIESHVSNMGVCFERNMRSEKQRRERRAKRSR